MPQWPKKKILSAARQIKICEKSKQKEKMEWRERERRRKRTGARCAALSDVGSAVLHAYDVMTIITSQRAQRVEARGRQREREREKECGVCVSKKSGSIIASLIINA